MRTTLYKLTAATALGLSSLSTTNQVQADEVKNITLEKKGNNKQKEDGELISNITHHVVLAGGLTAFVAAWWIMIANISKFKWRLEDKLEGSLDKGSKMQNKKEKD